MNDIVRQAGQRNRLWRRLGRHGQMSALFGLPDGAMFSAPERQRWPEQRVAVDGLPDAVTPIKATGKTVVFPSAPPSFRQEYAAKGQAITPATPHAQSSGEERAGGRSDPPDPPAAAKSQIVSPAAVVSRSAAARTIPLIPPASGGEQNTWWPRLERLAALHRQQAATDEGAAIPPLTAAVAQQPPASPAKPETASGSLPLQAQPLQASWPVQRMDDGAAPTANEAKLAALGDEGAAPPQAAAIGEVLPTPEAAVAQDRVLQTLSGVNPGKATASSIEYVPPRRTRPASNLSLTGTVQRTPAAPLEQQNILTEIGPLPADLWELLDQAPPVPFATAATDSVLPIQQPENLIPKHPLASFTEKQLSERSPLSFTGTEEGKGELPLFPPAGLTGADMAEMADRAAEDTVAPASTLAQQLGERAMPTRPERQTDIVDALDKSVATLPRPPATDAAAAIEMPFLSATEGMAAPEVAAALEEAVAETEGMSAFLPVETLPPQAANRVASLATAAQKIGHISHEPTAVVSGFASGNEAIVPATTLSEAAVPLLETAASFADALPSTGTGGELDEEELARRVFAQLRQRLAIEWERLRGLTLF